MSEDQDFDTVIDDSDIDESSVIEDQSESQEEVNKSEQEDKEAYSKRVQKRINKIHWQNQQEIKKRDEQLNALKQELEEIKKHQKSQAEDSQFTGLQDKQKDLMNRRKDAMEIGDYDAVNTIDDELMDIKIQLKSKPSTDTKQTTDNNYQEMQQRQEQQQPVNEAFAEWQNRNKWVFDQAQQSRLAKANQVYSQLLQEGYDEEELETYQELDKRLKKVLPPAVGAPDRGQTVGNEKGFTAEDRKMMVGFGLNPNDPSARKLWLKNKG